MADQTYNPGFENKSREAARLDLALDPTADPLAYAFVPTRQQLDGFRRDPQVNRTDLFFDENGNPVEAVSVKHKLGAQNFQVAGSPKNATIKAMIIKGGPKPTGTTGNTVMARYTDAHGMSHQGQAILLYKGEAGSGPADTTVYDFTLEWISAGDPTFPV